jgi:hypothetical protein
MADPNRPSTSTDLVSRYQNQKAGGAYDAKKAGTSTTEPSNQAASYDKTNTFVVNTPPLVSNFKGTESSNYNEISLYAKGLNTTKYKG